MNFFKGFAFSFRGLRLITQPGIRRFVAIPLVINISLFSLAIYFLSSMLPQWMAALMPSFPGWLSWIEYWINWILWPLFATLIFFIVFYSFTFIANLLAAPFNSLLAQKVEATLNNDITDNTPSLPPWKTIKKSIGSEITKLLYLLKWSIIIMIITLIPVINIAAAFLWLVFGAWMLALEYIDYPMGNHGHYFKEINQLTASKRTLTLGFGTGSFLLTSIPVINFIAMPASVAGATALWVNQEKK
ncbi:MAG: sulfate transporter CysZ [Gammaproteobacteria bacterium]|nr:sulfate transporter CysZ [Gammaproteobacteria bacterium]